MKQHEVVVKSVVNRKIGEVFDSGGALLYRRSFPVTVKDRIVKKIMVKLAKGRRSK